MEKNGDATDMEYLQFSEGNNRESKMIRLFANVRTQGVCNLIQGFVALIVLVIVAICMLQTNHVIHTQQNQKGCTSMTSADSPTKPSKSSQVSAGMAGVTYIRWGRTECPGTADLVYSGFAAGAKTASWTGDPASGNRESQIDETGGGSNYLCLTQLPHFNESVSGQQGQRSRIYAVEYRSLNEGTLNPYHGQNAPCVMCESQGRTQTFMMPATSTCPAGWTTEYSGYLSAARWNHARTQYVCVDQRPEVVQGAKAVEDNSNMFHVEIVSSEGLPSEYVTGNDLTCAICTK